MGSVKERYLQEQELRHSSLARAFGVSWDELASLEFEVHAQTSKDGLIYGYIVEFDEGSDPAIMAKIQGLDDEYTLQLEPWALDRTEDEEYELDAILSSEHACKDHKKNFMRAIYEIERLDEVSVDDQDLKHVLLKQLFIGIIGALETFLSDMFITKVLSDEDCMRRFIENHPEFRKQKISLSELYAAHTSIRERAKSVMVGTIYHKLPVVKEMYESTFNINFPDISAMQRYITRRHDLVHRNGKTTDGKVLLVTKAQLHELISSSVVFVETISKSLEEEIPF